MANAEHLATLEQGVDAWNKWRLEYPDVTPDLTGASLSGAGLRGANLRRANLFGANIRDADLRSANLDGAGLVRASIIGGMFVYASMVGARFGRTILGDCDLREVVGLESVEHAGPSHLCTDTIYRSEGKVPEAFLRGCGCPIRSLHKSPPWWGRCSRFSSTHAL